jgi:transcription-repair coupling factor (superfamily II helicase)
MSLTGLLSVIADDPQFQQVPGLAAGLAGTGLGDGADVTAPAALRPWLAAALAGVPSASRDPAIPPSASRDPATPPRERRFLLAVTATAREAEELAGALGSLLPAESVAYFPAWETLPHERLSPRSDTSGQRLAILRRLAHPGPAGSPTAPVQAVVTPVRALLQPMVSGLGDVEPVALAVGDTADLDEIVARLVDIGYTRTDLVEKRGDVAVRGGIIDVFPPTEEHPVRVEFFGDEVEETRYFRVADQRSLASAGDGLWAPPCRELLLTLPVRERAKQLAVDHPGLSDVLGKLADGIVVEGMEAFAPVLATRMELLLDHVPAGGVVLVCDPERIRARAADLVRTSQEFLEASWVNAAAGGQAPIDLGAAAFVSIGHLREAAGNLRLPWWTITPFESPGGPGPGVFDGPGDQAGGADGIGPGGSVVADSSSGDAGRTALHLQASPAPAYRGDTARALTDVRRWLGEGWRVALVTEGHGPAQRLAEMLRGEGVGARLGDLDEPPEPGVPCVTTGSRGSPCGSPCSPRLISRASTLARGRPGGCPAGGVAGSTHCS